jgi:inward rectifier potassium channel
MPIIKTLNKKASVENNTGLSTNSNANGGRFFNKDGRPNMTFKGLNYFTRFNAHYSLLSLSNWKFLLLIFLSFILINLLFACIYLLIGIEHLSGLINIHTPLEKFGEVFFFSAQTFTTVGYGRINPVGFAASFVAAVEALVGLMSFALITGLLYGRFSKPKAYIRYSNNALFTPFKDGVALMLRMTPFTKNLLTNVEAKITCSMQVLEDGIKKNKFFNLELEINKANTLISNWTLVHQIDENSPLYNFTKQDIDDANVELLVFVQGFDDSFSNTVVSRTSYRNEELVYGAKFVPMYHPNDNNTKTILELDRLSDYTLMELPYKM